MIPYDYPYLVLSGGLIHCVNVYYYKQNQIVIVAGHFQNPITTLKRPKTFDFPRDRSEYLIPSAGFDPANDQRLWRCPYVAARFDQGRNTGTV
jgi:hypothetical protein